MADPITLGIMAASTAISTGGDIAEGAAANKASKHEAEQIEQAATAKYAQGTREAYETTRQGKILTSDAIAQMAAGGGTTSDAGAVEQLSKIKRDVEYNALANLFERKTQAAGLRDYAKGVRYEGQLAKRKGKMKALSTVLKGGSKMYRSYKNGD